MRKLMACVVALAATAAANAEIIYGYGYVGTTSSAYDSVAGNGYYSDFQFTSAGNGSFGSWAYAFSQNGDAYATGSANAYGTQTDLYGYTTGYAYYNGYNASANGYGYQDNAVYQEFTLTTDYMGTLAVYNSNYATNTGGNSYGYSSNYGYLYNLDTGFVVNPNSFVYPNGSSVDYSEGFVYLPAGTYFLYMNSYSEGSVSGSGFGYGSTDGYIFLYGLRNPEPMSLLVFGGLVAGGGWLVRRRMKAAVA